MLNLRFRDNTDSTENEFNRILAVGAIIFLAVIFPLLILLFVTKLPARYRTVQTMNKF